MARIPGAQQDPTSRAGLARQYTEQLRDRAGALEPGEAIEIQTERSTMWHDNRLLGISRDGVYRSYTVSVIDGGVRITCNPTRVKPGATS